MNLIVAVDNNWAIGRDNKLLVRIPEDLRYFSEVTTNHVVVVGRKTLETFPGGVPLKNRTNIVLTTNERYQVRDALAVHSMGALWKELEKYPSDEIYVVGGASIYRQLLDYCDVAYVTKINHAYEADAWFPNLDEMPEWAVVADSEEHTYFDLEFVFYKYERRK